MSGEIRRSGYRRNTEKRKVVFAAASGIAKVQKMGRWENGKVKEDRVGREKNRCAARSSGASGIEKGKRPKRSDENLISPILEKAGGVLRRALRHSLPLHPFPSSAFPLLPRR